MNQPEILKFCIWGFCYVLFMYLVDLCTGMCSVKLALNPLSVNPTKWSNTPKQLVGCC